MIGHHTTLRRAATILFGTFRFRSHRTDDPLLADVDLLGELHRGSRRKLTGRIPIVFLRRA